MHAACRASRSPACGLGIHMMALSKMPGCPRSMCRQCSEGLHRICHSEGQGGQRIAPSGLLMHGGCQRTRSCSDATDAHGLIPAFTWMQASPAHHASPRFSLSPVSGQRSSIRWAPAARGCRAAAQSQGRHASKAIMRWHRMESLCRICAASAKMSRASWVPKRHGKSRIGKLALPMRLDSHELRLLQHQALRKANARSCHH